MKITRFFPLLILLSVIPASAGQSLVAQCIDNAVKQHVPWVSSQWGLTGGRSYTSVDDGLATLCHGALSGTAPANCYWEAKKQFRFMWGNEIGIHNNVIRFCAGMSDTEYANMKIGVNCVANMYEEFQRTTDYFGYMYNEETSASLAVTLCKGAMTDDDVKWRIACVNELKYYLNTNVEGMGNTGNMQRELGAGKAAQICGGR